MVLCGLDLFGFGVFGFRVDFAVGVGVFGQLVLCNGFEYCLSYCVSHGVGII